MNHHYGSSIDLGNLHLHQLKSRIHWRLYQCPTDLVARTISHFGGIKGHACVLFDGTRSDQRALTKRKYGIMEKSGTSQKQVSPRRWGKSIQIDYAQSLAIWFPARNIQFGNGGPLTLYIVLVEEADILLGIKWDRRHSWRVASIHQSIINLVLVQ